MKEISLSKGQVALIDDEDFILVCQYNWHASYKKKENVFYARGYINGKPVYMHRFIMGVSDRNKEVDHWDLNTLNNQRRNLRVCSSQQNNANKPKRSGHTSQYKGVYFFKRDKKWRASITINYRSHHLGLYTSEQEAAIAYNQKAAEVFGVFSVLNTFNKATY